ncbi:MAG: hypothetical protein ACI4AO_07835 [Anaerotignum sp.]
MKKVYLLLLLFLLSAPTYALASSYDDGYNIGYEEGYEDAKEKYDGIDFVSVVGGFILGYGFHEMFISKKE